MSRFSNNTISMGRIDAYEWWRWIMFGAKFVHQGKRTMLKDMPRRQTILKNTREKGQHLRTCHKLK
jgi:hypothetical protein